ncbi:amidohydrolase family protein [Neorhizobium galegae]|uniref:5-methylthioadenosine/S-adenosylhomocysteine deaminase n=1 Tax=Neorhizobium galegae bv. orientalis str. HAMBI 540 TaxID=1028800 RepID=A0A068T1Q6_NEOGA|nr:amidohydrolase family protein [Neorhizobium galegae]MCQ1854906.1 amidohydrolase family protein [Neorhizobium galegae]CDN51410.1 5-methylthioadenosine/S-adenosylhomocysteine deaminase [Neorhizobium galegae bv. orientalis str. HAMBI 540]
MNGNHDNDTPCDCCGEPIEPRFGRRSLLLGASGIACTGVFGLAAPAIMEADSARAQQPAPQALPDRKEYLIKGGSLITVDDKLGNIEGADIHVRNGEIVAIGAGLQAPGAEVIDASRMIVMPGMIDTHFHIWTSIMRNMLAPGLEYFAVKRAFVPQMTPAAFYASDMLAMAESLNAGVTTLHNYCHHVMSPDTVEAEMRAHRDSGMRALFTFGHHDALEKDKLIDLDLAGRVQKQWFGTDSQFGDMVTFGLNSRGPAVLSEKLFRTEMDWAFERNLPVAMHAGQGGYSYSIVPLKTWGYLGPKTIVVHFVHAKPEDRAAMAETGAPLSYSVHSELRLGNSGYQAQQLVHMFNSGVNVSLSFDANALAPIDMFESMSTAWYMGIPFKGTDTEKSRPINFSDVIKMGTINGAKALGIEDKTGSLTVGKRADIVLVRSDDLNMLPYGRPEGMIGRTARAANVDTVFVDGRVMKRGGKLVGLDAGRIKEDAVREAYDLRRRAGGDVAVAGDWARLF